MTPIRLVLNPLGTNCYIVPTEKSNCVIIDPAGEYGNIIVTLEENGLNPTALLLTHGHFDHIAACHELIEKYKTPLYIHKSDEIMLTDSEKALAYFVPEMAYFPLKADFFVNDGDELDFDNLHFTVMHTPGHTKGSVCYFVDNMIFTGDTLFAGSVGRTDCYSGNPQKQKESLAKLKTIDGFYKIYPGHGQPTDLPYEKMSNPYLIDMFFGGIF